MLCSLPLTLFLVITLIGIPVAMAFWMLAGVCTLMGLVAVANILGSRVPDVVVTDLAMPRMNGVELVRTLRSVESTSRMPIIAVSGSTDALRQEVIDAGADELVLKPVLGKQLLRAVDDLLARKTKT